MDKSEALRPTWYTKGQIECIDAMEAAFSVEEVRTFCRNNAFKYIWWSTTHKVDTSDVNVRKAIWFIERSLALP